MEPWSAGLYRRARKHFRVTGAPPWWRRALRRRLSVGGGMAGNPYKFLAPGYTHPGLQTLPTRQHNAGQRGAEAELPRAWAGGRGSSADRTWCGWTAEG